jgi:hypothetical protein
LQVPFENPDYAASCTSTDLSKTWIGIPRNAIRDVRKSVLKEYERAIDIIAEAGFDIIENTDFSSVAERNAWKTEGRNVQSEVHFREAIEEHCKMLAENPNNIRTTDDIIELQKVAQKRNTLPVILTYGSVRLLPRRFEEILKKWYD